MKKCEKCGKTFSDDTKFCDVCGAELVEVADAETIPAPEPVAEEVKPASDTKAKVKETANNIAEKWNALTKQTKIIVGAVAAVLVLIIICCICGSNKTTAYASLNKEAIQVNMEDGYLLVYNGNAKKKEISTSFDSCYTMAKSTDGTAYLIKDDDSNVYVVTIKGMQSVDEDIKYAWISSKGETVAYIKDYKNGIGDLYLYTVKTKKSVKVDSEVVYDSIVLSPDGKTVAYSTEEDGKSENLKALYSKNGKEPVIIAKNSAPVAISNGGNYVYYIKTVDGESILYLLKGKNSEKIVTGALYRNLYFNADLSEVLYGNDGKTYVSSKGKEAVKLNSNSLDGVLTGANDPATFKTSAKLANCTVYNIKSFKGATIQCSGTYYYVKSFSNVIKVLDATSVSTVAFSADQKSLVYIKNHKLYKLSNIQKPDNKKELGSLEDYSVSNFYASADLTVFYFKSDGDLYVKKNTKDPKRLVTDVRIIGMDYSTGGIYYYVDYDSKDTNKLNYSVNGSKGKVVLKAISSINYTNGNYMTVLVPNKKNDDYYDLYVLDGKSYKKITTVEK